MNVILFLCTGNYYRSRFAEEKFNFIAPIECPGWTAVSRGIAVDLGINNVGPIARSTAQTLQKQGIIFNPALARMPLQVEIADLESAGHIVALKEAEHFPLMHERFPSWLGRSDPCHIEYWHVDDIDRMTPEQGLPLIGEQLQGLTNRLSRKTLNRRKNPVLGERE
jgi:protein-tyrosine phosphatase